MICLISYKSLIKRLHAKSHGCILPTCNRWAKGQTVLTLSRGYRMKRNRYFIALTSVYMCVCVWVIYRAKIHGKRCDIAIRSDRGSLWYRARWIAVVVMLCIYTEFVIPTFNVVHASSNKQKLRVEMRVVTYVSAEFSAVDRWHFVAIFLLTEISNAFTIQ